MELDQKEQTRGLAVFDLMDADKGGTVSIDEICIVHDSDREAMIGILDSDGDGEARSARYQTVSLSVIRAGGQVGVAAISSFQEERKRKEEIRVLLELPGAGGAEESGCHHSGPSNEGSPRHYKPRPHRTHPRPSKPDPTTRASPLSAVQMVAPPVVRNLPAPLPELEDSQDPEVLLSLLEQRTERLRGTVVQLGDVYR